IARIQLRDLEARLAERDITMTISDAAIAEITKVGFDPLYGARPLKRAIQQKIENPIARLVLEGKYGPNDVIPIDFVDGQFVFERTVHRIDGWRFPGNDRRPSGTTRGRRFANISSPRLTTRLAMAAAASPGVPRPLPGKKGRCF